MFSLELALSSWLRLSKLGTPTVLERDLTLVILYKSIRTGEQDTSE